MGNDAFGPEPYSVGKTSTQTCLKCKHYARVAPSCDCASGYEEVTPGSVECQAPIPKWCNKHLRVESACWSTNEYD